MAVFARRGGGCRTRREKSAAQAEKSAVRVRRPWVPYERARRERRTYMVWSAPPKTYAWQKYAQRGADERQAGD